MGITFYSENNRFLSISCSGFNDLRRSVAKALGYGIRDIEFNGYKGKTVDIDYEQFTHANMKGIWKEKPSDPMMFFFVHSDYDGMFHHEDIEQMLPKLKEARSWFTEQDEMFKLIYLKEFDCLLECFQYAVEYKKDISI